ncbi:Actin-related protein 8 [Mycena venus]|uniref:Actin-related protein 8 n=1 Tax=Mycena venus TaxID=2733690 RepID=A0A8H6YEG0_9AGAR|nr:Actin-related protein 8 [Mycena venus]
MPRHSDFGTRNHSAKHALPDDPAYIDFPRSDGDSDAWPKNTTRVVDAEGCVNYMQPVGLDESLSIKWRVGVADIMASEMKLPGKKPYVLRDWPTGYRMFDHHKGKAANPRHDAYLFGSKSKFRSVPEFAPHAIWLMGDGSVPCNCKYCTKKPQREISSAMGLRTSSSPSPSRPVRPKPEKEKELKKEVLTKPRLADRLQSHKTYAAVQKVLNLPKVSPHIQTKNIMLVERNNNLRDACRPISEGSIPRWFREGELVWCALETPIVKPELGGDTIKLWPAIIDEVKLRIDPQSLPHEPVSADEVSTPWVARQSTAYKVQFLAIQRSYLLPDTMIASQLSGFWCLTDDWEAKLALPPAVRPPPPPSSLQSAIELAGNNNANIYSSISSGPRGQGPPPPPPRIVNQTRFQGLWWGGERIWADDLVRLKVPRSCLAPQGAQHIFAPSGPGNKSRLLAESRGKDPTLYGAGSRGVFMKIDTIFIVDGVGKRECRVTGMLYELADIDWEDPNLPRNVESISSNGVPATAVKLPNPSSFRGLLCTAARPQCLISGRYYPRILQHPLMKPTLNEVIPLDRDSMISVGHIWALEGLFAGYKNAVDPTFYKASREKMVSAASEEAMVAIQQHIDDRRQMMDVDD